jgi:hypothetical protein
LAQLDSNNEKEDGEEAIGDPVGVAQVNLGNSGGEVQVEERDNGRADARVGNQQSSDSRQG